MRKIIKFNKDWTFTSQKNNEIERIDIPHTWNAIDGVDGGDNYYRGIGTYKKSFSTPNFNKEKEDIYLEFLGVNSSAEVFINNQSVTVHHGGYSTFRINITEHLAETNELKVEVDNGVNDEVYPQKADFTFYGGIYRDINLIIVNKKHFDLSRYGGPAIKVTPHIDGKNGKIEVETFTKVSGGQINITLRDTQGNVVASHSSESKLVVLNIKDVHLWKGTEDPYLYIAEAQLIVDGEVTDKISTRFGVRSFRVDSKKGFFLNGKSYPLNGVSRHQDREGFGNAITKEHHDRDMELIREVGANSIRLAHYQHDQYFYDLCDEYGMVVWAEIPYISEHLTNGNDNTISQMKELIIQNYNHPSIVTWGISNEITISTKDKKAMLENHHYLNDLCHKMDPTRPTVLACYAMCNPFSKVVHISDIVGYNLYLGWYVPGLFLNDLFIKGFHFFYPDRALSYSEYGCEGMPNLHSEKPRRGDHSEEYQAKYHEYMLKCFEKYPFMWSTYVWNMFDFGADARDEGGIQGRNHKGLVTFDRKLKKDSFYLYKAHWNSEPMVHICSKRFVERNREQITVKVYSNQPEVSLYQNGKLIETKKADNKIFEFDITLVKDNNIEAVAGDLKDKAYFKKVDKVQKSYVLGKSRSRSSNWV